MPPTDPTVNERIATEVMGWRPIPYSANLWADADGGDIVGPDYEHSLDACALAEAEIERRGLLGEYATAVCEVFIEADTPSIDFYLIRLTPEQRCEAMLKAVES